MSAPDTARDRQIRRLGIFEFTAMMAVLFAHHRLFHRRHATRPARDRGGLVPDQVLLAGADLP